MIVSLASDEDLACAVAALIAREPRFAAVTARHGMPPLRRAPEGFAALLQIVTEQMISLSAARAIWLRLQEALQPCEPGVVLRLPVEALMGLGLSGAKARSFHAIATADVDFSGLHGMSDDEVLATLTAIPGIGPWTAEIYLLANLGRPDVWPAGDVALQVAAQDIFGLHARPDVKTTRAMAEAWRPWRAVAARLLWSHYRHLKGLPQAVTG